MTVVVIGQSGQLARHLRRIMPDALFWGRRTVDAADARQLEMALIEARPSAIINAAAYTAVDLAEQERVLAWRLNAEAPAAAGRAATKLDVPLVHISTDFVFDGRSSVPYIEDASVNPLNTYGRTKLAGELAVQSLCDKHWILRTSWLFSEFGANFVTTMIRLAESRNTINVVADQFGRPTYAGDLAGLIRVLVEGDGSNPLPFGTYHATDGPVISWHDFAELIFREAVAAGIVESAPEVHPIPTSDYPTAAVRPLHAVLEPSKIATALVPRGFDYVAGLRSMLTALAGH
jgi:dTDP-4-dehydrorhamnose reductase